MTGKRGAARCGRSHLAGLLAAVPVVGALVLVLAPSLPGRPGQTRQALAAGPNPSSRAGGGCLPPTGVRVVHQILQPYRRPTLAATGRRGLSMLRRRERLDGEPGLHILTWSPDSGSYIYTRGAATYIQSPGARPRRLFLGGYDDIAFSADGTHIVYRKAESHDRPCASLLLMTSDLEGRQRHLLLAGNFSLPGAIPTATGHICCAGGLQQDMLIGGRIALVSNRRLFVFDPRRNVVGPLTRLRLPALYAESKGVREPIRNISISPTGSYLAIGLNSPPYSLTIEQIWNGRIAYRFSSVQGPFSWGPGGRRLAFPVTHTDASHILSWTDLRTLDLHDGNEWTVHVSNPALGLLFLGTVAWSRDGGFIGFHAGPAACDGLTCGRETTFVSTWKGKDIEEVTTVR